jgi:hypothetical protein
MPSRGWKSIIWGQKETLFRRRRNKGVLLLDFPPFGISEANPSKKKLVFRLLGQKETLFRRRRNKGVLLLGFPPFGISEANPSKKNLFSGFGAKRKPVPTQEEQRGFAFGLLPIRDQRS